MGLLFTLGRAGARQVALISISVSCGMLVVWGMIISQEAKGWRSCQKFQTGYRLDLWCGKICGTIKGEKRVIEGERVGECRCKRKGTNKLGSWGGWRVVIP